MSLFDFPRSTLTRSTGLLLCGGSQDLTITVEQFPINDNSRAVKLIKKSSFNGFIVNYPALCYSYIRIKSSFYESVFSVFLRNLNSNPGYGRLPGCNGLADSLSVASDHALSIPAAENGRKDATNFFYFTWIALSKRLSEKKSISEYFFAKTTILFELSLPDIIEH